MAISEIGTDTARAAATRPAAAVPPYVLFVLGCVVLILFDLADGVPLLGDVDDQLRALQVRDLLADGQWWDMRLPFIAMPEPYLSPWSRLIDAPYVIATWLFEPMLGREAALALASSTWPMLLGVAFSALACSTAVRLCPVSVPAIALAAMGLAMALALWEYVPSRMDHHNVQLLALLAMLHGATIMRPRVGGWLAGSAAAASMAIGLEGLPLITVLMGALALSAAFGDADARDRFRSAGLAMMLSCAPLAFLSLGPAVFSRACDVLALPWIAAMACGGAGVVLSARMLARIASGAQPGALRLVALAPAALAPALAIGLGFPECLAGPYAMIDPVSAAFWLDRVAQEQPALSLLAEGRTGLAALLVVQAVLLAIAAMPAFEAARRGNHGAAIVWVLAAAALLLTFVQVRYIRFPAAFAPLLLPMAYAALAGGTTNRRVAVVFVSVPLLVASGALITVPRAAAPFDAVDLMNSETCDGADFASLHDLPPSRFLAPMGVAMPIAEAGAGHSVAALPYHRASPGIRRVATAFTSRDPDSVAASVSGFDIVAVCASGRTVSASQAPLFAALAGGEMVPGFVPLSAHGGARGLLLYRIDHARQR